MTISVLPTADDRRTNASFEELMWAISRPGLVRGMPFAGFEALAESLIDRECTFHASLDPALDERIARTGARRAAVEKADYVFAPLGGETEVAALSQMRIGTLSYPDESSTLFAPAIIGTGQALRLIGPGIKGEIFLRIGGVHPSFWAMRAKAIRYPLGWELYLVDGDRLVGIPRTTKIEVL
ncbi:phosphonate C-P lyase system protein PhnH [Sinorhizobium mexicanum]|nr:phosphonate C-P lyase system protein PhnH [Sinorhizobium mexicanum]MBP1887589.1 alpha-D-ribose 1-methylphosphonate 5-triphosphate synthase subunit PhnH [Sinorhizobium mexicanum]